MAYTTFQKEFWSDDYVLKLNEIQKLVYVYIITNEKTTQCGIYELPILKATTELSISAEEFLINLKKFNDDKKISYSLETQEICVINWLKHNENNSWKTMERVRKELAKVKNPNLVILLYDPREPLFNGVRKKNIGNKQYVEEPYQIINPWFELFKGLSDEVLKEIRQPYLKYAPLMPLLSPFDAPSMGHLPYTNSNTNSESYTNSNTKTKAETVEPMEHNTNYPPPPPLKSDFESENKEPNKPAAKLDQFIKLWNELVPQQIASSSAQLGIGREKVNFVELCDFEEYKICVEHYAEAYEFNKSKVTSFLSTLSAAFTSRWFSSESIAICKQQSEFGKNNKSTAMDNVVDY